MKNAFDTIAAVATPPGEAGLAVLRVSGSNAIALVADRFHGRTSLKDAVSHTAHLGFIVDAGGAPVDQVVCTIFRAPHSYTGEDVVEISCHGGALTSRRILNELITSGARVAEPGEFTKRAFLNSKMDLAQAEAVADLIHARSDAARRASMEQLQGRLSEEVQALRALIIDAVGLLELELDFAEDGYEFLDRAKILSLLDDARGRIGRLVSSYRQGRIFREGVKLVLAGAPNAGKSSLLNALLKESRAIVNDIPGTTRDVIEESLSIGGVLFRVADTAGLREARDPVEQEGVRRARDQIRTADVVILVVDLTSRGSEEDVAIGDLAGSHLIVALNKCDLVPIATQTDMSKFPTGTHHVRISALTGEGIPALEEAMLGRVLGGSRQDIAEGVTITSSRHHGALVRTDNSLRLAHEAFLSGRSGEFAALDLRGALAALGEITGEVTTDDILNAVFSRFCIGK